LELAVVPATLLSILAKRGALSANDAGAVALQLLEQVTSGEAVSDSALRLLEGLHPDTARDVERFLNRVIDDRTLIHELTPHSMARLNAAIAGGARAKVVDFVSVAPPPTTGEFLRPRFDWAQRALYAAAYLATQPTEAGERPFPGGRFLTDGAQYATSSASDGIVPCASQVFDEAAAGIVLGDHLDVVGHFDAHFWRGATVFKSDARFDKGRFHDLWSAIGKRLVGQRL
jgi:hypothetical protein